MKPKSTILHIVIACLTILANTFHMYPHDDNSHNEDTNVASHIYPDSIQAASEPSLNIVKTDAASLPEPQATNLTSFPSTRGSTHISKAFEIDKNKEVGEIPYTSSTNKFGAKTYEVPIEVYSGINGFQPALALTYNSQNGNSITGKGWTLSGISSIRRTVKNLYYDGKADGVRMNGDDAFTLDGVRLIKTDSSDKTCIQYETEYGHIKVNGYRSGDIQTYFEVFYPNGEKGVFGYEDSRSQEMEYPLTVMTDLDDNIIEYKYDHPDSHYLITGISYNGCSVEFSYMKRQDPLLIYSGGKKVQESSLLHSITAKHGQFPIGTYELAYTYISGTALLSDINYYVGSKALNPLRFFYGDDSNITEGFETATTKLYEYYDSNPKNLKSSRGRLYYEECEDVFVVYPNRNPYWRKTHDGANYDQYINNYPEDAKIFAYSDLGSGCYMPLADLTTGKGFIDAFCADIDGRMEESLIRINNYVSGDKDIIEFSVYRIANGASLYKAYTRTYEWCAAHIDRSNGKSVYPKFFHAGDFNGDGKTEVLAISTQDPFGPDTGESVCRIFDLSTD